MAPRTAAWAARDPRVHEQESKRRSDGTPSREPGRPWSGRPSPTTRPFPTTRPSRPNRSQATASGQAGSDRHRRAERRRPGRSHRVSGDHRHDELDEQNGDRHPDHVGVGLVERHLGDDGDHDRHLGHDGHDRDDGDDGDDRVSEGGRLVLIGQHLEPWQLNADFAPWVATPT
jgi:hypothetical protein